LTAGISQLRGDRYNVTPLGAPVNSASKSTLLLTAALACVAGPALAESASSVSEVVVTGQRQAYRGQFTPEETPQSLVVISQRILQDNNITGLTEALDLNAGVARQNNFGGLWDAYAVRGFAGDENLPSGSTRRRRTARSTSARSTPPTSSASRSSRAPNRRSTAQTPWVA